MAESSKMPSSVNKAAQPSGVPWSISQAYRARRSWIMLRSAAFGSLHGLSLGHAEDGQLPAPMNGKQPERNHHSHAGPKRRGTLETKRLQEQVESDTHDCGSGVEVSPQDVRHFR